MRARVTSHDVASEAGVSQATVARAFSNPTKVADRTRLRVHEAADKLGYVPNAIARSLKAQRSDIVGAVVPSTGEYWQHVVTSFARVLRDHGKQLLLFSFDDAAEVEAILDTVAQYRLDGLILASVDISTSQTQEVSTRGLPSVAFNQPTAQELVPAVTVDNELGMRHLAAHLVECGISSATFVGGRSTASTDQTRRLHRSDSVRRCLGRARQQWHPVFVCCRGCLHL